MQEVKTVDSNGFSNEGVGLDALPQIHSLTLNALSPRYRPMNLLFVLLVTLIEVSILLAVRFQPWFSLPEELIGSFPYVLIGLLVLDALWAIYHFLADPLISYAVREQDVTLCKGLIFRKTLCQPILRIQHVELERGPFERIAGLATLSLFSAGGESHTFEIPGLEEDNAQRIRQFILEHKDLNAG